MEKNQLFEAIKMLAIQRNLETADIFEAIREALETAYKKKYATDNIRVEINQKDMEFKVFKFAEVETPEGIKMKEEMIETSDFGRIASQMAKQIILSKIKDAEREKIYKEYKDKVGELITGTVRQTDRRFTVLDLGNTEALLPPEEQIPRERYTRQSRVKAVIIDVRKAKNEPQIIVSRTHPMFVKKLFEFEVPEIQEGICEIKSVAREPGYRSKIAVASKDKNVDPTGACVGPKGSRVKMVVSELKGEKVDVVSWDQDPAKFVANALGPARITKVVVDQEAGTAYVVVPDEQLSLAIGKEGQNARLAAKLTALRIDIKSETEAKETERQQQALREREFEIEKLLKATIAKDLAEATTEEKFSTEKEKTKTSMKKKAVVKKEETEKGEKKKETKKSSEKAMKEKKSIIEEIPIKGRKTKKEE